MWLPVALGALVGDLGVTCTQHGKVVPCPQPATPPVALARSAGAPAPTGELPEEVQQAMEYDYTLQYTSVDPQLLSPLSPNDPFANRCLAAIGEDEVGGVGLGFAECAHYPRVDDRGQPLPAKDTPNETILFNFFPDGKLRNKATGLCIRRVPCTANLDDVAESFIYDLGACEEESAALFLTWKAIYGSTDTTSLLGPPLRATATACGTCGPFLLKQRCGPQNTAISCGIKFIKPGWTNKKTMLRPKHQDVHEFTLSFAPSPRSLCGTMVQETPAPGYLQPDRKPPWYYFHRYKDGKLRKMANAP